MINQNVNSEKKHMWSYVFLMIFIIMLFTCVPNIITMACGGSACAAQSGSLDGECPSGCSGGTCYANSLSDKCRGHNVQPGPNTTSPEERAISGPTETNRVYIGSTWSGTTDIDTGKQKRVRTDSYQVTYTTTYQQYRDEHVKCTVPGCRLSVMDYDVPVGSPYTRDNTVTETETSDEYRIRSVVNQYLQKTDGAWPSSPSDVICGEWGEWYGDYTGHAASYVGGNLPKMGAANVKAIMQGWSRGITDTHYASNTHAGNSKTDADIPYQTATDNNRTWYRYIYRKQYYLQLYHNKPANASTSLKYMSDDGDIPHTSNHAANSGKYMKVSNDYYQRLCYVGEKYYIPKTYQTYQMIGYASRNTWYTAITNGTAVGEGKDMNPLSALSGYGDPSTLYVIKWYAQWFSEPGKIYLMPNSSRVGTDSCFGAYIDDSTTENDTFLHNERNKHSNDKESE